MKLPNRLKKLFRYPVESYQNAKSVGTDAYTRRLSMWQDLNSWLDLKAPNTQKKYRAYMREFCSYLGIELDDPGFKSFCVTTSADASRYLNWCKTRPAQAGRSRLAADSVSLATIKDKANVLFSIFEELINQNELTENPFTKYRRELRKVRGNDRRPHQLIPFEKVLALMELDWRGPKELTMRAILAALFGGGLRSSEALNLRLLDVKRTAKGNLYLNLRNTKRQKQEAQALPEWAGQIIMEHLELRRCEGAKEAAPLFTDYVDGEPTNEPIFDRTLRRRFTKALSRVGLHGHYSPHCARATAITALLEDGVSHRNVAKFSRHASVDMVSHYDKMRAVDGEEVAVQLNYRKKGLGNS